MNALVGLFVSQCGKDDMDYKQYEERYGYNRDQYAKHLEAAFTAACIRMADTPAEHHEAQSPQDWEEYFMDEIGALAEERSGYSRKRVVE